MTSKIEEVRYAYELAAMGLSGYAIAKITGQNERKVYRWLNQPETFSPYIDEVAIHRALEGEREVYRNLSTFEARVFWERAARKSDASSRQAAEDPDTEARNPWAANMSELLGWDNKQFRALCSKAKSRMKEAGTW
jgi:hypothetical protein